MSLPFQTVRISGKQPELSGNLKSSKEVEWKNLTGQGAKLPCASWFLHRLRVLFLLLNLLLSVLKGKQKQNVYAAISG